MLLVHALSQAPQNEFQLPFVPVWIGRARRSPCASAGASMTRIDVIRAVVAAIDGPRYLEIGVKDGECFDAVDARRRSRSIRSSRFGRRRGAPAHGAWATTGALYYRMTSDVPSAEARTPPRAFDVVFVDGLHTYDQAYPDVVNALDVLREDGVVVVHDCNPASAAAAAPSLDQARRTDGFNCGTATSTRRIVRLRARDDLASACSTATRASGSSREAPRGTTRLSLDEIGRLGYVELGSVTASCSSGCGRRASCRCCSTGSAADAPRGGARWHNHRRATARADPSGRVRARRRSRGARPGRPARAARRHAPVQRAHRGQAGGLGPPRLHVQLTRPRRPPLWEELNVAEVGFDSPDRDVFFSSKGHDVPGLYAALNALGVIPTERPPQPRRLGARRPS